MAFITLHRPGKHAQPEVFVNTDHIVDVSWHADGATVHTNAVRDYMIVVTETPAAVIETIEGQKQSPVAPAVAPPAGRLRRRA